MNNETKLIYSELTSDAHRENTKSIMAMNDGKYEDIITENLVGYIKALNDSTSDLVAKVWGDYVNKTLLDDEEQYEALYNALKEVA